MKCWRPRKRVRTSERVRRFVPATLSYLKINIHKFYSIYIQFYFFLFFFLSVLLLLRYILEFYCFTLPSSSGMFYQLLPFGRCCPHVSFRHGVAGFWCFPQHWLDPASRISRQLKPKADPYDLYFGVKFYAADPCKLVEEITR